MTTLADLQADWQQHHTTYTDAYQSGRASFIPNLLPQTAVRLSVYQTLDLLHKRLGTDLLRRALDPAETIDSPVRHHTDGTWLKTSNMVGINVRTIGSFWKVIAYTLTLPAHHDSIHLLPIWEPGVVGSLYGMVSWQLNPEFFDVELAQYVPALNTVEKQLKAVTNLLHATGRTVGMDVIPHTDRFSEMVLTSPSLFEWVHREKTTIVDHTTTVYRYVEEAVWQFLKYHGAADGTPITFGKDVFFSFDNPILTDEQRARMLFGQPHDYGGRLRRRLALMRHLLAQGFETLPMTMAPPYRGLHIDANDFVYDDFGQIWYQYAFDKPQKMSRVFGPLARYRFYESKDNNQNWELDFDRPVYTAWQYICQKVHECQRTYNFDFMRGDMAHVQMRPEGVPNMVGHYYDPLKAIKRYIRGNGVPHFAFFAETFLAPPDTMGYGNELDHLDAIDADSTLGDLQSLVVGSAEFRRQFALYDEYLRTRRFAPNFTVMTADKDDPRFDEFYRTGNIFRYFTALFLTDWPSYTGLGFEVRNLHPERGPNEEYTKLYVFQIEDDRQPDKVTHGPFVWGQNAEQFATIGRIRAFAERIWNDIEGQETHWLVGPADNKAYVAWTHAEDAEYVFAASMTGKLPTDIPGTEDSTLVFEESGCRVWRTGLPE
ncbi:hypothetical protein [Spirosoma montaniterrae]|uniref:Uncharacterized protein n=1 Tax=Spirosoma montaniterrae TaxID=1178516 RepID=A0A1P9WYF5_9BACT|nr:hypothetical protein [Spirosoma montaniterrae]AQG80394.1 hypothetical protein AWR27_14320 [Spirosoma montaniterrae]